MELRRDRLSRDELVAVLAAYPLSQPDHARELPRGSRRSAKVLIESGGQRYILKRRASGRDDPARVAFQHALTAHLHAVGFPCAAPVATRDGALGVRLRGRLYELYPFVEGERFDGTLAQATDAGVMLARLHRDGAGFTAPAPAVASFHDNPAVLAGLNAIPTTASSHDSVVGREAELLSVTQELYERYEQAASAVEALGAPEWTARIIHGDWHPGNLLFRGTRVAAVLDFDAARRQPRVIDVANAMLQFSILREGGEPDRWPDFFDESRMRRVLVGYLSGRALRQAQRLSLPWLMVESIIAESAVPIAATGSLGTLPGFGVLQMVRRKVRWLLDNEARLRQWVVDA